MSHRGTLVRSAGVVAFFTLLSRILGLVRDMVVAYAFGSGAHADAFFVAFRIPNLLRRLVAEGALTASFLPVYTDTLENRSPEEAQRVVRITFSLLSVCVALISLAGVVFSPWVIQVFAPGFRADPDKFHLAVSLNRIVFPYLFFISLVALCMGILNAQGHFAAPAASPVLLNVAMIAGALGFSRWFDPPIYGLAVGVLAGGFLQLLLQVPPMAARRVRFGFLFTLRDPAVNQIGRLFLPAAFGAAVYQLNTLVSTIFASFLPEGSVSYLWYAGRLLEFPLGVFGMALAIAAFPRLSQESSRGDAERFRQILEESLRMVTFVMVPATIGLVVLSKPIVQVLFQRGEFDSATTVGTTKALVWYCVGMWPIAASRILVSAFYSLQDTATPVRLSVVSFAANVAFSLVLMGPMGHAGLALANSLAAAVNVAQLLSRLRSRTGASGLGWFRSSGLRILVAGAAMGLCLVATRSLTEATPGTPLPRQILLLFSAICGGALAYGLACALLGAPEIHMALHRIRRRVDRRSPTNRP